jgi:hypothetical protein
MQANGTSRWAERKIELQSIFASSFQDLPLFFLLFHGSCFVFTAQSCLLIEQLFMPLSERQDTQMIP